MAKLQGAARGVFGLFAVIFILNLSQTHADEGSIVESHLRDKRQVAADPVAQSKNETGATSPKLTNLFPYTPMDNGTTNVKPEPPGNVSVDNSRTGQQQPSGDQSPNKNGQDSKQQASQNAATSDDKYKNFSNATVNSSGLAPQPSNASSSTETTPVPSTTQAFKGEFPPTSKPPVVSEPINPPTSKVTKTSTPKKVITPPQSSDELDDDLLSTFIDVPFNDTEKALHEHNITNFKVDYHEYYNSTLIVDPELAKQYWESFKNITPNQLLSNHHRRAITIMLKFDFPFYGHPIRNITVATGGFIYTGDHIHSWLAATQYIAPLMANFDTGLSNDSYVKFYDNGTAFTVLWENVSLQEKENVGQFTFSATLHKTGDIVFAYYSVPIEIQTIEMDKHPVKVGLSDAYVINKVIFFARRKTIYEYHRVNFESLGIKNSTIIYLDAQPTCLHETQCNSCLQNPTFKCYWCPALNKCSTGTDRNRQDWLLKGCDRIQITDQASCPAVGEKGNNAAQLPPHMAVTSESTNNWANPEHNATYKIQQDDNSVIGMYDKRKMQAPAEKHGSSVGLALGLMLPICLVMSALVWIFYAYRNPHTRSGQCLIQYRPSQWSWRRGEARYTAATIHM